MTTGILAAINLALLHGAPPYLFSRLWHVSWPLVLVSVAAGATALATVLVGRTRLARPVAAVAVVAVVAAWGWAQYPYVLLRSLSLAQASAPPSALTAQLVVVALAIVLVGPPFGYLYWLQQHGELAEGSTSSAELRKAVAAEQDTATATSSRNPAGSTGHYRLVAAVFLGAAAIDVARDSVALLRRRPRGP